MTLDTVKMEARLLQHKLKQYQLLVRMYQDRYHIMVSQLESLTGLFNVACLVVAPGRPFLKRLYSLKEGLRRKLPHYRLRFFAGMRQDLFFPLVSLLYFGFRHLR